MPSESPKIEDFAHLMSKFDVDYVLVGGLAVFLQGGEIFDPVIEVIFDPEGHNFNKMADTLAAVDARPKRWRSENYRLQAIDLRSGWLHLESDIGDIDLLASTPGTDFEAVRAEAEKFAIGTGVISVASLDSLIAMKSVATRDRDKTHLAQLEAIRKLRGST